jgi:hypothetical protein
MKKIVLGLLLVILPIFTFAQTPVEKVFKKYSGKENCTTVTLNKDLFKLITQFEDQDPELEALKNLELIKIVAIQDAVLSGEFYKEINVELEKLDFSELMNIKEKADSVKFLVKQKGDIIKEMVMLAGEKEESAFIYIKGDIKPEDISKIAEMTKVEKK